MFLVKEEEEGQMKLVLSPYKAMMVCSHAFTKQVITQTYKKTTSIHGTSLKWMPRFYNMPT